MSIGPVPVRAPGGSWRRFLGLPSTGLGRWAIGLAAGFVVLLVVAGALSANGLPDWGWGGGLVTGLTGAVGVASAIAAGVLAVVSVVKGERSIVLLVPLLFGAFWLMFVLGEFLSPH